MAPGSVYMCGQTIVFVYVRSHTVMVHAGGATKSDLWLQIHADVSNLPLILTE